MKKRLGKIWREWNAYIINTPVALMWAADLANPKAGRYGWFFNGTAFGIYIGIGASGIFHKMNKRRNDRWNAQIKEWDDQHEQFKRRMWEIETEEKIRQKYAKQAARAAGTTGSGLEEYQ